MDITSLRARLLCPWACALVLALAVLASAVAAEVQPGPQASLHDGILLKPTTRAEEFAFAKKPTITTEGRNFIIHFATAAYCDVTIGIIRKKDGKIVRHLASGVLGSNAPEPFQKDSLEQTIIWDGKDDQKRYIDDLENYVVKVSLGLKPVFGKIIGWHPKDNTGSVSAIGADEDGVYVLEASSRPRITMYDHEGNYVRVVFPPAADIPLSKLEGLARQPLPEGGEGLGYSGWGISGYGTLFPLMQRGPGCQSMVVSQGRIAFMNNGYWWPKRILHYRTDGTTLAGRVLGRQLAHSRDEFTYNSSMAASPDGKWLYVTNLGHRRSRIEEHVVFQVGWDEEGPPPKGLFIGQRKRPGDDNYHLNTPRDIACDSQGRIYVADTLNHRIQVFNPEGEHLKTIPVMSPGRVGLHQKTGEIYVVQQDKMLLAIGTFENPHLRATWNLEREDGKGEAEISKSPQVASLPLSTVMCVDSWAEVPTIWIGRINKRPWPHVGGQVLLLLDRGDHFELAENFEETVRRAGLIPHMWTGSRMPRVKVDPTRDHVYYEGGPSIRTLYRFDTRSGKLIEGVRLPYQADEMAIGPNGLMYVRALGSVGRFDPITWREVPFDYGVHLIPLWGRRGSGFTFGNQIIGGLKLYDEPGAKAFQDGIGVNLNGEVSVLSNIYDPKTIGGLTTEIRGSSSYQRLMRLQQLTGYRPLRFPGRSQAGQSTVWVFNSRGELKSKDVIAGLQVGSCGIQTDVEGNLYVGFAGTPAVDGKPFLPGTGAVVKFVPTGGKFFGDWATKLPLKELPSRSPDFFVASARRTDVPATRLFLKRRDFFLPGQAAHKLWVKGALWAYGGLSSMVTVKSGSCTCPNNRFALDYYARSFIPETYRFSVGVVDTNGNLITRIGRYGNEDSRGPGNPVLVGGDEIAFAFPCFVAVKDGELYVSDSGNDRMVQVFLEYHREETLNIPAGSY